MQESLNNRNKKQILIVSLLIIAFVAILFSFVKPNAPSIEMKIYNNSRVLFTYPNWLNLNNTENQLIKINKNDDLIIIWKFPKISKSLSEYGDELASRGFGRLNYTTKSSRMLEKNNLRWYLNCGSGVSVSGKKVEDCYAITQCNSIYIIQATTLKGTSLPKEAFDDIMNSFVCLGD